MVWHPVRCPEGQQREHFHKYHKSWHCRQVARYNEDISYFLPFREEILQAYLISQTPDKGIYQIDR
jgi:hypothetical protein